MADVDLTLPLYLWHSILMLVAADDLWAALNCRSVSVIFRNLIDDHNTYGVIDMGNNMYLPQPDHCNLQLADPHRLFYFHCLEANNPEALFREAMRTLKITGNVPLCMQYLHRACMGIAIHPLSVYVLNMFYIIRGPDHESIISICDMSRRLHHISGGWNIYRCRQNAHTWIRSLENVSVNLAIHIPRRHTAFLPMGYCERCGESRYLRAQDNEHMHRVNGDRTLGPCCNTCLGLVEAAAFFNVLRNIWFPA